MLKELILKNRSYRRFDQADPISIDTLRSLVDLARLSASAANLQPLKFVLSADPERNALIFQHLAWAGYLKEWPGPAEGERPSGYIVVLGDRTISKKFECDLGIAAQSILLGATELGWGGCMIGSVKRESLQSALKIPSRYEILLVIALGKPAEEVMIEPLDSGGDIKYWRDGNGVHHVPKRSLDAIVLDIDAETDQ